MATSFVGIILTYITNICDTNAGSSVTLYIWPSSEMTHGVLIELAGFRHVIGTLWNITDETCLDMGPMTYKGMRDSGMTNEAVCVEGYTMRVE